MAFEKAANALRNDRADAFEEDTLYINKDQQLPRDKRILVVGAGPAGVHMSAMLRKKGYDDITILERSDRVGGKSFTAYADENGTPCSQRAVRDDGTTDWDAPVDRSCNAMDMGTVFLHNGYHRVRNLAKEYGLTPERAPVKGPETVVGGDQTQAIMAKALGGSKKPKEKNAQGDYVGSMGEYIIALVEKAFPDKGWLPDPMDAKEMVQFLKQVETYNTKHRKYMVYADSQGGHEAFDPRQLQAGSKASRRSGYTFPERPSHDDLAVLSKTFKQYLDDNGLTALKSVLAIAQAAQGYGYIDEIPAYYGLLWMTPEVMCGFAEMTALQTLHLNQPNQTAGFFTRAGGTMVNFAVHAFSAVLDMAGGRWPKSCDMWTMKVAEITTMFPEGYNAIWQKIYEQDLRGKIDFMVSDLSITRGRADEPIRAEYTAGTEKVTKEFDFMVYAAPPMVAHRYIKDLTEFEKSHFAQHWTASVLATTIYKGPPIQHFSDKKSNFAIMYSPDNIVRENDGSWYADKNNQIFCNYEDFSDKQLRLSIQYFADGLGDIDRSPRAAPLGHAAVDAMSSANGVPLSDPAGRAAYISAMHDNFRHLGVSSSADLGLKKQVQKKLKETLAPHLPGGKDSIEIQDSMFFPWPYFPRFDAAGIKAGNPWDLEEAQGDIDKFPKTWYVGGSMVFESVNDVVSYNLRLLHRYSSWSKPFEEALGERHAVQSYRVCQKIKAKLSGYWPCEKYHAHLI